MNGDAAALFGFTALFGLIAIRVPIGIAMGLVGVFGFSLVAGVEPGLNLLALSPIRTATEYSLGLIPLFLFMGAIASESGMSGELYRAANTWMGHRRGGTAMATIVACGAFSGVCGSSVATAASMCKVALPEMRRAGYPDSLATGVIGAGGTLGILIPPSVVLAIYAIITNQDIGRLFMAGILPGLLALVMYMVTVSVLSTLNPNLMPVGQTYTWRERFRSLKGVWPILTLFAFVIGGIYGGMFTPVEAAGMGATGALIISLLRGSLSYRMLVGTIVGTLRTTGSIFLILIGALLFGYFLSVTQAPQNIAEFMTSLQLGAYGTLAVLLLFFLALGCILDAMAMIVLTVPIFFPIVVGLGFDPVWFGVIVVMTVELALITPPIGLNVFVIKGVAEGVSLSTIYRGVAPFIVADVLRLLILIVFPSIALFLPQYMN